MHQPDIQHIFQPVLTVEYGMDMLRALVYDPDVPPELCAKMCAPSPARIMAESIVRCTGTRTPVYLQGMAMGRRVMQALHAHCAASLPVALHPELVPAMGNSEAELEALGITVTATCPSGYEVVAGKDADFTRLAEAMGLPKPDVVLVAAEEYGHLEPSGYVADYQDWLQPALEKHETGLPLDVLFYPHHELPTPHYCLPYIFKRRQVTTSFMATMAGFVAVPSLRKRSYREGVALVQIDSLLLRVALVYKNKLFGYVELPVQGLDVQGLLKDLEAFRLGWLPSEKIAPLGGAVYMCSSLPAEAEGFRPLYITGTRATLLQGNGQMVAPYADAAMLGCWGLLAGYAPGA